MKHIVSVVVYNNSGVLSRVSSLFGRRGFNIDSLSVATTDDPKISRITITARGDENTLDQIIKQTSKLEETINVTALKEEDSVCRELILVKVVTTGQFDNSIVQLADEFGALILDITAHRHQPQDRQLRRRDLRPLQVARRNARQERVPHGYYGDR